MIAQKFVCEVILVISRLLNDTIRLGLAVLIQLVYVPAKNRKFLADGVSESDRYSTDSSLFSISSPVGYNNNGSRTNVF